MRTRWEDADGLEDHGRRRLGLFAISFVDEASPVFAQPLQLLSRGFCLRLGNSSLWDCLPCGRAAFATATAKRKGRGVLSGPQECFCLQALIFPLAAGVLVLQLLPPFGHQGRKCPSTSPHPALGPNSGLQP